MCINVFSGISFRFFLMWSLLPLCAVYSAEEVPGNISMEIASAFGRSPKFVSANILDLPPEDRVGAVPLREDIPQDIKFAKVIDQDRNFRIRQTRAHSVITADVIAVLSNAGSYQSGVTAAGFRPEWIIIDDAADPSHAIYISLSCFSVQLWTKQGGEWNFQCGSNLSSAAANSLKAHYFDIFYKDWDR